MAASNWGLITNIVNSIVGVSVLTMPFCFKQCGILLGSLLLLLCCWMTHQSCMFLVKSASVSKRRTYAGLAFHAYGKAGKMLVETSMIGLMLGTCIAFYVVIGDLGSSFFARILGLQVTEGFRVFLLFSVSLCIVLPLSLQRNMMNSIQSFSAMALMFYTVFMFVIVLSSFKHGIFSGQWLKQVSYIRWEGVFRCIPIYGMSFACQSQVLPTYDSLDEPSVKIMSSIFALSLNVVTTFYVMVGFFGYVSFTESIAGNVLVNFPSNVVTEMIRVGFMMSVAVGFPMMILPCRQALNTLLFEQQQKDGTFTAGGYMPPIRFKVLTLIVVFGTMLGGILIPNVETILGLTGATMGSLICFICPALIYKKIHNKGLTSQFILGVGLVILVISTYATMTVNEQAPAKIKLEPLEKEELHELKTEKINLKISAEKPVIEEPGDDRDKPKMLPKKPEEEQIKGPIEVPEQEERKQKQEEVQLDRPDQADIAQPMGEAHRHEPPVPRDEVDVDEQKDQEEKDEKKESLIEADAVQKDDKQEVKAENEPEVKDQLNANKEINEPVPQNPPQEVGDLHKQENLATPKVKELPPFKDLEANRKDVDNAAEPKDNIEIAGEKADEKNELHQDQDPHVRNVQHKEGDDQEEAGKAELLDHAFLLQVIKEQQVQQKRLLDQQEKLLEVIKEQHMEIHQQKDEDDHQAEKPDGNVVEKSKEELKEEPLVAQKPAQVDTQQNEEKIRVKVDKHAKEEPEAIVAKEVDIPNEGKKLNAAEVKMNEDVLKVQKLNVEDVKVAAPFVKQSLDSNKESIDINPNNQKVGILAPGHIQQEKVAVNKDDIPQIKPIVQREAAIKQNPPAVPKDSLNRIDKLHKADEEVKIVKVVQGKEQHAVAAKEKMQIQEVLEQQPVVVEKKLVQEEKPQENKKEADVLGPNQAHDSKDEDGKREMELQKDKLVADHEEGNLNRDLKLQNGLDLRRKRRDLGKEESENDGAQIIDFHPVPNVKVNDLRGALEARLNQVVEGGLQVVQSRQIKQLTDKKR
ncbi:hypothetical protein GDO86_014086 [Hymenochirus boettgeri]|uniref:Amino acid transporter transmembrane domain-containing protein n=1 Tax=Hymenochirus boettgeri TaxID=247094 RepID=A0A8T2JSN1_9PIPI|nr:hypothetical protein GDO86_014086 [Hymenochirus boettgeri]